MVQGHVVLWPYDWYVFPHCCVDLLLTVVCAAGSTRRRREGIGCTTSISWRRWRYTISGCACQGVCFVLRHYGCEDGNLHMEGHGHWAGSGKHGTAEHGTAEHGHGVGYGTWSRVPPSHRKTWSRCREPCNPRRLGCSPRHKHHLTVGFTCPPPRAGSSSPAVHHPTRSVVGRACEATAGLLHNMPDGGWRAAYLSEVPRRRPSSTGGVRRVTAGRRAIRWSSCWRVFLAAFSSGMPSGGGDGGRWTGTRLARTTGLTLHHRHRAKVAGCGCVVWCRAGGVLQPLRELLPDVCALPAPVPSFPPHFAALHV